MARKRYIAFRHYLSPATIFSYDIALTFELPFQNNPNEETGPGLTSRSLESQRRTPRMTSQCHLYDAITLGNDSAVLQPAEPGRIISCVLLWYWVAESNVFLLFTISGIMKTHLKYISFCDYDRVAVSFVSLRFCFSLYLSRLYPMFVFLCVFSHFPLFYIYFEKM